MIQTLDGMRRAIGAVLYLTAIETLSYPLEWIERLIQLGAVTVLLVYSGQLVDADAAGLPTGYGLYALSGLATATVLEACLTRFQRRLRQFQLAGVLEVCLSTRTPFWQFVLAIPVWDLTNALIYSSLLVAVGLAIDPVPIAWSAALWSGLAVALGALATLAIGVLSASAVLVFKRGEPLTRIVQLASLLFGGAFFPRTLLPEALASAAGWLPIAPTLDIVRGTLFEGRAAIELGDAWLRLALLLGLLTASAALAFRVAIRRAVREGGLSHY